MPKIKSIKARKILNSRAEWTLEVIVEAGKYQGSASVPSGASIGKYEAKSLPANKALKNVKEIIAPKLKGQEATNQEKIDKTLIQLDGTSDKSNLGANAILGVSLACARAGSFAEKKPLFRYLNDLFRTYVTVYRDKNQGPYLFMNLINGGVHAGNNLDFQEYLIVPLVSSPEKALEIGVNIYQILRKFLKKNLGPQAVNTGEEGGFAPNFLNFFQPLEVLTQAIRDLGYKKEVRLALDIAANNLKAKSEKQKAKNYNLKDKTDYYFLSGTPFSPKALLNLYQEIADKFDILSIEDPFFEEDFLHYATLKKRLSKKVLIVGDDLTVTNASRIKKAVQEKAIDAVIIKPNQIGTLSETFEAIKAAREYDLKIIVSHRSGETNDSFISDLAWAVQAWGLKAGAPVRGERVAKYNRLLKISQERL